MLLLNWYLLGVEMNFGHAHKTRFWYLLGVFSKISDETPVTSIGEYPPGLVDSQLLRFSPARILASLKSTSVLKGHHKVFFISVVGRSIKHATE